MNTQSEAICALMTIFRPDIPKTVKNLQSILRYSDKIFLLGNSKIPADLLFDTKIIPIENKTNFGISHSINIGMKYAANEQYAYVIFFDQDSFLEKNDFWRMFSEMQEEEQFQNVACIGPRLKIGGLIEPVPRWIHNKKRKISTKRVISVKSVVTSGMIVNTKHFNALNGFNEDFPVDFSDLTFCWKAIRANLAVLQSVDIFMDHEFGIGAVKISRKNLYYHHPYRYYFMARDVMFVCCLLPDTPLILRFRLFCLSPIRMIIFTLMLNDRSRRLKMYALGLKDFFCNKRGFGSIAHLLGAGD